VKRAQKDVLTEELFSSMFSSVPNKRSQAKKFVGGYMSTELKKKFQQAARKEAGGDQAKFLCLLIKEGLKRRGIKTDDEPEDRR